MRALALHTIWIGALAAFVPVAAHAAGQSAGQRIEQGLEAAGEGPPAESVEQPLGITVTPDPLSDADVSLEPSADTGRLSTTLNPIGVKERIDKGLTAAGETSAIPPDYAFGAFQRGWFLTSFSLALERAEKGDAVAQTLLGVLLSRGLGVKQDLPAAADWFRLAGQGGDPEALYALGQFHLDGRGVKADATEAAKLFRQAADRGHAGAARELGYLLLAGKGVDKNEMLAAAYLSRAARSGDMDAQFTLGGLFVEGIGVVSNEEQAARWYGEAAQNGHVGAQVEYAIMLFNGRGVTKNEAEATYWFGRAAEEDNPPAQVRLARILAEREKPEDDAAAARWYLIAKSRDVEDSFLENWLSELDAATREKAAAQAEAWVNARRGRTVLATAQQTRPPAVDNALE